MCEKCNIELVSRAGLKGHTEKCQKKSYSTNEALNEKCANGPDCRYFKEDRCHYQHDEPNDQPWERVQHRRQGRQKNQKRQPQARQHSPRQQPPRHLPSRQQSPREQSPRQQSHRQQSPRQQLQECRNGPGCIYWKHDRCNFAHSGSRQQTGRGVDSRQQRPDLGSRQQRQDRGSRQQRPDLGSRQQRPDLDSRQHLRSLDSSQRRQEGSLNQGKPCKFGAKCDRILSCGFLHFAKDFLSVQGQRRN